MHRIMRPRVRLASSPNLKADVHGKDESMNSGAMLGWIGGIVGGIVGVAGGIVGTYFSIKNSRGLGLL